jgi:predicted dehydrogenase
MPEINLDLDYEPKPAVQQLHGIGIVGAGEIVNAAHLPAYRRAGFRVVGITARPLTPAQETARSFDIPRVYPDLDALLADPAVEVVDIAVPAVAQPEIALAVVRCGKHVLCQKPLAPSYAQAKAMVEAARAHGVKLAVNQNGRWTPALRASRTLIRRGLLGTPTLALFESSRWGLGYSSWLATVDQQIILYSAIHFLDALRFLFGMPETVYATGSRYPGQREIGETLTLITLEYASGLRASVLDSQQNWTGEPFLTYRFEGTDGVIHGTIGMHANYPRGQPDTLHFRAKAYGDVWFSPKLKGQWIPDAFVGTMGEFLEAIEQGHEPPHSGADNLVTLQIVFAAYRSMEEKRAVSPWEIG